MWHALYWVGGWDVGVGDGVEVEDIFVVWPLCIRMGVCGLYGFVYVVVEFKERFPGFLLCHG